MILGPFNYFHAGAIRDVLTVKNIEHAFVNDPDAKEAVTDKMMSSGPIPLNRSGFQSSGDFLYLDIADKDEAAVKVELERLGVFSGELLESTGDELDHTEYLCPDCEYISSTPGQCPHHKKELREFSDWVAGDNLNRDPMQKYMAIAFAVVVLAGIYFKIFRFTMGDIRALWPF